MTGRRPVELVAGVIVFVATIGAYVYLVERRLDTAGLVALAVPVIGALFLAGPITKAAESSAQAASQTNGVLDARIQAAVSKALATRDAARTRQARGDISEAGDPPTESPAPMLGDAPTASPSYQLS